MQAASIYDLVAEVVREVLGRDDLVVTPATTAADVPGWDSFKQIEIILALEERYAIKFSSRDMDAMLSIGDLARILAAKLPSP